VFPNGTGVAWSNKQCFLLAEIGARNIKHCIAAPEKRGKLLNVKAVINSTLDTKNVGKGQPGHKCTSVSTPGDPSRGVGRERKCIFIHPFVPSSGEASLKCQQKFGGGIHFTRSGEIAEKRKERHRKGQGPPMCEGGHGGG